MKATHRTRRPWQRSGSASWMALGSPQRVGIANVSHSPGVPRGTVSERKVLGLTHRRLLDLHEIGKLLIRFEASESAIAGVLSILARALASSGVLILYQDGTGLRLGSSGEGSGTLGQLDQTRIKAAYGYLAGVTEQLPQNDVAAEERHARPSSKNLFEGMGDDRREKCIVLPLVVTVGRAFGAVQIRGSASFDELDLVFANMVVSEVAIALTRRAAADAERAIARGRNLELRHAERQQRFISDVSAALIDVCSQDSVLARTVRFVVPSLAEACFADEISEDGALSPLKYCFTDEAHGDLNAAVLTLSTHAAPQTRALGPGMSLLISDLSDTASLMLPGIEKLRAAGARSVMRVNLEAHGRHLGALTLVGGESRNTYGPPDLRLAEEIASRVAMALDNERHAARSARLLRDRQEVLALVSHDLRDPLAALSMGAAGMLQRAPESDRRRSRKTLDMMDRSVRRMDRMIGDLLDTSSLEAGRLSVLREWHAVSSIVSEAVESHAFDTRGVTPAIRVELPEEPCLVFCDRYRVLQVLTNLVGNAVKFTPQEGSVVVAVRRNGLETTFSVTDTGRGMAPEEQSLAFEPHWQARAADVNRQRGAGLGLYICRGIVEAHGGKIWVESELHKWSAFTFTIPHGPPAALPCE